VSVGVSIVNNAAGVLYVDVDAVLRYADGNGRPAGIVEVALAPATVASDRG
jgi:hypothetical protein